MSTISIADTCVCQHCNQSCYRQHMSKHRSLDARAFMPPPQQSKNYCRIACMPAPHSESCFSIETQYQQLILPEQPRAAPLRRLTPRKGRLLARVGRLEWLGWSPLRLRKHIWFACEAPTRTPSEPTHRLRTHTHTTTANTARQTLLGSFRTGLGVLSVPRLRLKLLSTVRALKLGQGHR